ncbi:MAG: hypothetical protein H3Z54_01520 [archaeon]|nr:hypothetical protein [archaeon]
MNEKVIERTIKYTIPTPKELFESFRNEFSKTTLPDSWETSRPWTITILGIFDRIGHNFGYKPRKEYLALDRTWEIRHPDISVIVMALEHENQDPVVKILDDELQKLLDTKALLKVLIFYPEVPSMMTEAGYTYPEIQEKIESAKIKNPDEKYVIMSIIRTGDEIVISACLFDSDGKGEDLGDFRVKYSSKD